MTTSTAPAARIALSRDEVEFFHREGYLGPFAAVSPDEMSEIRAHIDEHVLTAPRPQFRQAVAVAPHGFQSGL